MLSTILKLFIILALLFTGFIFWAQSSTSLSIKPADIIYREEFESPPSPSQNLKIITYNIGYASGVTNNQAVVWPKEEIEKNLKEIAQNLKRENADILGLQEVDFNSKRTYGMDQLRFLQEELKLPYAAYIITWNKNYLPWPYWPLKVHYGRMVSGQAVLSRYPITSQEILTFDKPRSNSFWYNWFYLDRKVQKLNIALENENITVWHAHLEAFDPHVCLEQAKILSENIQQENSSHSILVGDLNSFSFLKIPLSSPFYKGGKRGILIEERKQALDWILTHTSLKNAETEPFYTMPSKDPIKKIDHILYGPSFKMKSVHTFSSLASDHLPVIVELTFPQGQP